MRFVAAVLVCLALPTRAFAQSADEKDPSVAVALSVGVTAAGAVTLMASDDASLSYLGLGALYVGPSTGIWYAGEFGGIGLGARALGGVAAVYGLSQMLQSESDCEPTLDADCSAANARARAAGTRGAVLMITGASLWVGSSIADVIFAKRAADRWNQRHAVTVAPTAFATPNGSRVPGLVLGAQF